MTEKLTEVKHLPKQTSEVQTMRNVQTANSNKKTNKHAYRKAFPRIGMQLHGISRDSI